MAGTNKSYHRNGSTSYTTQSRINSTGKTETYRQYDVYIYGPGDSQYYAQGPERVNQSTTTKTRINSCGELESYKEWNGTAGKQ